MNDWMDGYGVNQVPDLGRLMQMRAAEQQQREAAIDAIMAREAQMKAINSPFVQNMMQNMMAQPQSNVRPTFGPGMAGAVREADQITPNYPSKMGVDLPPGQLAKNLGGRPDSQPGVQQQMPGSRGDPVPDPKVEFTVGELERTPPGKPQFTTVVREKRLEKTLKDGRIGARPLNLRQPIPREPEPAPEAPPREQMTPEQYAIYQQNLPQMTQRRVAQEQATSAEDRKYADLDLKNRTSQMRTGYDIWKTSVDTAAKLKIAEDKARAAGRKAGPQNRMLRDLVPAMSNIRTQLEGESNRLSMMLQSGWGVSQNPAEQQAVSAAQMRIRELMQSADAATMQYTTLFNETYSQAVPTLKPTVPVPTAPPGQGKVEATAVKPGLTPAGAGFLQKFGKPR